MARERWYDDLWRWQRRAWAEFARMACGVALQAVYGGEIEFASPLSFQNEHRRGEWVMHDNPLVVLAFRKIGVVIEVLDGRADELTDALSRLGSSAFLRFSDMQGQTQQYIAVWTVLTMANTASLADLVASADETIEFFQQTQPDARLAGGFILQSEANPEADARYPLQCQCDGCLLWSFRPASSKGFGDPGSRDRRICESAAMSGLVGLDLNGLWDWAAFKETESGDPSFRDGGVNGAAISLARYPATFVVGPQTVLAPHGRGPGMGRTQPFALANRNFGGLESALGEDHG